MCIARVRAASSLPPWYCTATPMAGGRSVARLCRYTAVGPSKRANRARTSFSPMRADSASISFSTVWPSTSTASRPSTSAGFCSMAISSRRWASATNSAFLATKSVSQSSSSSAPPLLTTTPLVVERSRRLPTSLAPLMRSSSIALSYSPSASVRAFLASIMPAPVASRRRLTSAAVKAGMSLPSGVVCWVRTCGGAAPRPLGALGSGAGASAVLGALGAGLGAAGGGHALDRSDLLGGDGRRRGRGLRQLGGRGVAGLTGEQLALPVGQRLAAADGRGLGAVLAATGVGLRGRAGHQALGDRVGDDTGQQRGAADGVVVARDLVVDLVGVAVCVEDRDDRDAQLAGLTDGDVLLLGVHDPDGAGHLLHVADAAEGALELGLLAGEDQLLLLRQADQHAGLLEVLELLEALQPLEDGLEVGEDAAQPALVHVGHAHARGLLGDDLLRLALGADEHDRATVGHGLLDELVGLVDVTQRLLDVDDVDAVALGEDEALHLRVPAAGLVPEVDAAVEQLLHADDCHAVQPFCCARRRAPRSSVVAGTGWCTALASAAPLPRRLPVGTEVATDPAERREEDARSRPAQT